MNYILYYLQLNSFVSRVAEGPGPVKPDNLHFVRCQIQRHLPEDMFLKRFPAGKRFFSVEKEKELL